MTMVSDSEISRRLGYAPAPRESINLAAKQMCMEAQRMVCQLMTDGVRADVVMPMLRYGHCWCVDVDHLGKPHRVCCKCGDRYAAKQED